MDFSKKSVEVTANQRWPMGSCPLNRLTGNQRDSSMIPWNYWLVHSWVIARPSRIFFKLENLKPLWFNTLPWKLLIHLLSSSYYLTFKREKLSSVSLCPSRISDNRHVFSFFRVNLEESEDWFFPNQNDLPGWIVAFGMQKSGLLQQPMAEHASIWHPDRCCSHDWGSSGGKCPDWPKHLR